MRLLHDNSLLNPYYLDWSCRWHRLVVFIATIASQVTLTHWYLMVSNLLGEREQALTVSCTGMSWPLTANRGCDWKLNRKKCHGLHLYYPHKRAYSNATRGGTCLKCAPQKGLLAVPGSSCAVCQLFHLYVRPTWDPLWRQKPVEDLRPESQICGLSKEKQNKTKNDFQDCNSFRN